MNSTPPPAYLKYIPVFLVLIVVVAVYYTVTIVEKEIPSSTSINEIIREAKRAAKDIERIIEDKQRPKPKRDKSRQAEKQVIQKSGIMKNPPKAGSAKSQPLFVSLHDEIDIRILSSSGVNATFDIVEGVKSNGEHGFTLKLSVKSIGSGANKNSFASGVIDFKKVVDAGSFQAIGVKVKGEGVNSFGLAVLSKTRGNYIRWDYPNNPGENRWVSWIIPFKYFDLWNFDTSERKYTRLTKRMRPGKIDQVQVYLKPNHLNNGDSGALWIESMTLSD